MTLFELQGPVSRPDSILFKMGDALWQQGLEPIFLDGIPFSGRNNKVTAKRHAAMIDSVFQQITDSPLKILEIGACHGILTLRLLQVLQESYPGVYEKITLYVTDYSENALSFLKQNDQFRPHFNKLVFIAHDELFSKSSPLKFDYIYHSYFYNAFPCKHLYIENGQVTEWLIQTFVTDEKWLHLFQENPYESFKNHERDVIPFLVEKIVSQRIVFSSTLPTSTGVFNFSEQAIQYLNQLVDLLSEKGVYCFSDVCLNQKSALLQATERSYTVPVHYFPISPFFMKASVRTSHVFCEQVYEEDDLIDVMITSRTMVPIYEPLFRTRFSNSGLDSLRDFLKGLPPLSDDTLTQKAFLKLTDSVEEILQTDYYFFQKTLHYTFSKGWLELAQFIAELMINEYGDYAFDAFRVLAVLKMNRKELDVDVQALLEHVLTFLPNDQSSIQLLTHLSYLKSSGEFGR